MDNKMLITDKQIVLTYVLQILSVVYRRPLNFLIDL